ncbi:ribosome hibernation-promoting factor, HPF/YfiA family [Escherichia coli]
MTEALREFVTAKFAKLGKYFRPNQPGLCCSESGESHPHLRCNTACNGGEVHASAEGKDMYAAIDGLIDKLARQLTKHKDKLKQH